jgi:2,4-dienoyl-CoA reductase-like NADH-dependent reductase (Old Yellow Enzyme family)
MDSGFDGVEIHGGNGYLVDQFLNSNVNQRADDYGGSPEKRCAFALELIEEIGKEIGLHNVAMRLSPFGIYNDMADSNRWDTYNYLCVEIKERFPEVSYVHFVEARKDEVEGNESFSKSWGEGRKVDLSFAREILAPIPMLSAGGWDKNSCWGVVEKGETIDACVFARWFVSNPDLVERLRLGRELTMYNRGKFYGPTTKREVGFTDYLTWDEEQEKMKALEAEGS